MQEYNDVINVAVITRGYVLVHRVGIKSGKSLVQKQVKP